MALGIQTSSAAAADSGSQFGPITITGGGGSLLPKVPTTQAWIVWLVVGVVAWLAFRWWQSRK